MLRECLLLAASLECRGEVFAGSDLEFLCRVFSNSWKESFIENFFVLKPYRRWAFCLNAEQRVLLCNFNPVTEHPCCFVLYVRHGSGGQVTSLSLFSRLAEIIWIWVGKDSFWWFEFNCKATGGGTKWKGPLIISGFTICFNRSGSSSYPHLNLKPPSVFFLENKIP